MGDVNDASWPGSVGSTMLVVQTMVVSRWRTGSLLLLGVEAAVAAILAPEWGLMGQGSWCV